MKTEARLLPDFAHGGNVRFTCGRIKVQILAKELSSYSFVGIQIGLSCQDISMGLFLPNDPMVTDSNHPSFKIA